MATASENTSQSNPMKEELVELTRNRIKQYIEQEARLKEFLKANPKVPDLQRAADFQLIAARVQYLKNVLNKLAPYVKSIRARFAKITDRNRYVACYLLFGKVLKGFDAIFILANGGFHYEIMEAIRTNREAMDLVHLFLVSTNDDDLNKWFDGRTIKNEKARSAMDKFMSESQALEGDVPLKELASGIYHGLSSYSHVTLTALLDSVDIYHNDFDFDGYAGAHYTAASSLPYLRGELVALIITLKHYYSVEKDTKSYDELSALLAEAGHEPSTAEQIAEVLKKYGKVV